MSNQTDQNPVPQTATPPAQTAVVAPLRREYKIVEDESPIAYLLDTARFEHTIRIANLMASAGLLPKHLRGDTPEQTRANCFLVVNQAFRWKLDPFAVAPETYEVGGKLAYQGKLVAAVINARAGLAEKLSYAFNGKQGDELEITVSGRFDGEEKPRTVTLNVKQAKTPNQMWARDPEQKLIYSGAIRWARRHTPEVILGVLSDDDADELRAEAKLLAMKPAKTPDFDGPKMMPPATKTDPKKTEAKTEPAKTAEKSKETPSDASKAATTTQTPSQGATTPPAPAGEAQQSQESTSKTEETPKSDEQAESAAGLAPLPPFEPKAGDTEEVTSIKLLAHNAGLTEAHVMVWARFKGLAKETQKSLSELAGGKLINIGKKWMNAPKETAEEIKTANAGK